MKFICQNTRPEPPYQSKAPRTRAKARYGAQRYGVLNRTSSWTSIKYGSELPCTAMPCIELYSGTGYYVLIHGVLVQDT